MKRRTKEERLEEQRLADERESRKWCRFYKLRMLLTQYNRRENERLKYIDQLMADSEEIEFLLQLIANLKRIDKHDKNVAAMAAWAKERVCKLKETQKP